MHGSLGREQSDLVPGLDLWVHSEPFRSSDGGGDVYYLSSCALGRITRMLLADVSGHGASVAPVAVALRDLMRRNINFIKQTHLIASLNSQFERISATGCFATRLSAHSFLQPERSRSAMRDIHCRCSGMHAPDDGVPVMPGRTKNPRKT